MQNTQISKPTIHYKFLALAISVLFSIWFPLYFRHAHSGDTPPSQLVDAWLQGTDILFLFIFLFVHFSLIYYAYLLLLFFTAGKTLLHPRIHLIWKGIAGIMMAIILWGTLQYDAHLEPIQSYTYQLADKPILFEAGRKSIGGFGQAKECQYEILGWDQSTLYYEADCLLMKGVQFAFHAETGKRKRVKTVPENLFLQKSELNEMNLFDDIPDNWLSVYLNTPLYESADKQYLAIGTQYIFGPQDMMILQEKEPTGEQK